MWIVDHSKGPDTGADLGTNKGREPEQFSNFQPALLDRIDAAAVLLTDQGAPLNARGPNQSKRFFNILSTL